MEAVLKEDIPRCVDMMRESTELLQSTSLELALLPMPCYIAFARLLQSMV